MTRLAAFIAAAVICVGLAHAALTAAVAYSGVM